MEKKTVGVSCMRYPGSKVQAVPPERLPVAQGILTSNEVIVTDKCTLNQHRKRGNDGQWANRIQRSNPHIISYLCNVAWDVSINLPLNLQRRSYGIVTKAAPKPTTGVKKTKGLSVIEDRAYAQAMYTATCLFTLDHVKRSKAAYHDRWPSNHQVKEWKARAARA
jgi:hypothetical protein